MPTFVPLSKICEATSVAFSPLPVNLPRKFVVPVSPSRFGPDEAAPPGSPQEAPGRRGYTGCWSMSFARRLLLYVRVDAGVSRTGAPVGE